MARYSLSPTKSVYSSKDGTHWVWPGRMPVGDALRAVKKFIRAFWATMIDATGMDTRPTPIFASSGMGMSSVFIPETASMRLTDSGPLMPLSAFSMSTRARMPSMKARSAPAARYMLQPLDGFVDAPAGEDVGPGVDDEVLVQPVADGGAGSDLAGHLLGGDDFLAGHVAAALGEDLVLDVHAGEAHGDDPLRDPGGVDGVPAARVEVGHDRDPDRLGDVPGEVEDVLHPDEADVGLAEEGPRQAVAGDLDGLEPALFDDLGAQGVVTAGDDDRPPLHDGFSENTCLFHYELLYYGFPP